MIKLYKFTVAGQPRGHVYGRSSRATPPIACPKCGWRMCFSPRLPCVDIGGLPLPGKPVTPSQFQELVPTLSPFYPPGFPVQQQQGLGQLIKAEHRGRLEEVVIVIGAGPSCIRVDAYEKLINTGIAPLSAMPIRFSKKTRHKDMYVQVEANGLVSMSARVHPTGQLSVCELCGNNNIRVLEPERLAIKESSIPPSGDLFAVKEWGDILVATERFRQCAEGILRNAEFRPIPVFQL